MDLDQKICEPKLFKAKNSQAMDKLLKLTKKPLFPEAEWNKYVPNSDAEKALFQKKFFVQSSQCHQSSITMLKKVKCFMITED